MKKYIYILFASLGFLASCEEDLVIYDGVAGQTYGRFGSNIVELPVVFDSSAETTIPIELSTLSESDRTVSVEVVSTGAENEADPSQYDFPSQVVVPANSYTGDLVFTGIDNGIEIGETKTVTLQITDISGAADANLDGLSSTTVSMFQVCPVESDFFIGDYELTTTATGIFGSTVFPQGVVTIEQGESSNDARSFTAQIYPDLGTFGPIEFNFTLVCGTVVVSAGQVTGVGCAGTSTTIGPRSATGGYTAGDDSVLVIDFADDEGGASCGAQANASITLTKI
jgi:hypothetical protein